MVLVLTLREIPQYLSSKIVLGTPVILMSRITIASGLMINGYISSRVKLESVHIHVYGTKHLFNLWEVISGH